MPEFHTLVLIENSSNKLRILPSESIKSEPLDERILYMTNIDNWSTFRCGISQLKSRITFQIWFWQIYSTESEIWSYYFLDQRKKKLKQKNPNARTNK